MSWYRAEDYRRILEIMEDADKLHSTYDQWLRLPNAVNES